jgi:hypothetical protein
MRCMRCTEHPKGCRWCCMRVPSKQELRCCAVGARRHLAASEGCYKVTEWLLEQGSDVNVLDRFKRTPLEARATTLPWP